MRKEPLNDSYLFSIKRGETSYFNQDQVHLTNCFKSLLLRGLMTISKIHLFCSKLPKRIKIDPPSFSYEFLYQDKDKNIDTDICKNDPIISFFDPQFVQG